MTALDQAIALGIIAAFIGACFYIWDNIRECGRRALAEQVGAERDASLTPPRSPVATTSGTPGASTTCEEAS